LRTDVPIGTLAADDSLRESNGVVDQVEQQRGRKVRSRLEQQAIGRAQQRDRQSRQRRMTDGEEGRAPKHGTPFADW
jgi:hypothetical protein